MALVMTSPPVCEPVTVDEAKTHLRVDGTHEDVLVSSLSLTSRLQIETSLSVALSEVGQERAGGVALDVACVGDSEYGDVHRLEGQCFVDAASVVAHEPCS